MRSVLIAGAFASALAFVSSFTWASELKEVRVGFSSIVPETLIAKEKGFVEEQLRAKGVTVRWVESLGSNKTLEFLRGKSLDIGPTSVASAFLARANGTPIKYVYWTARQATGAPIIVRGDSPYRSVADLRGKKIAATPGTGPYISLIAALRKYGLKADDVEIVGLQHPQGRAALISGSVEAWAGLEPDWSIAELKSRARVLFADPDLADGGGVDVRQEFLEQHPDVVKAVLQGFEQARLYARDNTKEAISLVAETSKVDDTIAANVLKRYDKSAPAIRESDFPALAKWGELYKSLGSVPASTDVKAIVRDVLDPSLFAEASN